MHIRKSCSLRLVVFVKSVQLWDRSLRWYIRSHLISFICFIFCFPHFICCLIPYSWLSWQTVNFQEHDSMWTFRLEAEGVDLPDFLFSVPHFSCFAWIFSAVWPELRTAVASPLCPSALTPLFWEYVTSSSLQSNRPIAFAEWMLDCQS